MALDGAADLDRALAKLADEVTDKTVATAAAALVVAVARPLAAQISSRVANTGKAKGTARGRATAEFGSPAVPWTAPAHFSHGSPGHPRPQGGWMTGNMFLFRGADEARDDVIDLYLRRTGDGIRKVGLG